MSPTEILLAILPILMIEIGLKIHCILKLIKEGQRNLTKMRWMLMIIFLPFAGPFAFIIWGRKKY